MLSVLGNTVRGRGNGGIGRGRGRGRGRGGGATEAADAEIPRTVDLL